MTMLGTTLRQSRKNFNASSVATIRDRLSRSIDSGNPFGRLNAVLHRELSLTPSGLVSIDHSGHPDHAFWRELVEWGEDQGLVLTLSQSPKSLNGVCEIIAIPDRQPAVPMERGPSFTVARFVQEGVGA